MVTVIGWRIKTLPEIRIIECINQADWTESNYRLPAPATKTMIVEKPLRKLECKIFSYTIINLFVGFLHRKLSGTIL